MVMYVAGMTELRNAYTILIGKLEDLRAIRTIVLKWFINKYDARVWIGFILLGLRTSGGFL
jgi:hypothetical protein